MSGDLEALLEEARALRLSMAPTSNSATVNFSGGIGILIAASCAVVMLVINVMQLADRMRQDNEIRELRAADRRHDDYLSAIYMQAPHLRPKEETKP